MYTLICFLSLCLHQPHEADHQNCLYNSNNSLDPMFLQQGTRFWNTCLETISFIVPNMKINRVLSGQMHFQPSNILFFVVFCLFGWFFPKLIKAFLIFIFFMYKFSDNKNTIGSQEFLHFTFHYLYFIVNFASAITVVVHLCFILNKEMLQLPQCDSSLIFNFPLLQQKIHLCQGCLQLFFYLHWAHCSCLQTDPIDCFSFYFFFLMQIFLTCTNLDKIDILLVFLSSELCIQLILSAFSYISLGFSVRVFLYFLYIEVLIII